MTLLELLVKELPKRGGWPEGYNTIATDGLKSVWAYTSNGRIAGLHMHFHCNEHGCVTREQYEDVIANNAQPEPENKVTRLDILDAINIAVSMKLEDAMELTETLMDAFDIKHK